MNRLEQSILFRYNKNSSKTFRISYTKGGNRKMNKKVEGIYATVEEAMAAVERLSDEGYNRHSIYVVANEAVRRSIPFTLDAEVTTEADLREDTNEDDRSLWEKIKDAFTFDQYDDTRHEEPGYDASEDVLAAYREDLRRGSIVILLDDDTKGDFIANDTTDSSLEEDVKATDPPLLADQDERSMVERSRMDLTTTEPPVEPPLTDETVNDVNVPLQDELDLANQERERKNSKNEVDDSML